MAVAHPPAAQNWHTFHLRPHRATRRDHGESPPPLLQLVWLGRRPPQNAGGRGPWTLPLARSVCPAGPVPDGHNAHGGALAAAVRVPGPHHARSDSVTCRPLSPAQVVGLVLAVLPPCTPTCASFLPPRPPVYPLLLATAHHGGLCRCRGRPVCGGRLCGARRLRVAVVGVCGGGGGGGDASRRRPSARPRVVGRRGVVGAHGRRGGGL